ncbi:X-Pro dipeptidyl-peptidase [Micromonospora phaseoli]|uniref:Xaa-Pro dipeptidyl-peptidase n=1 Tax=Micromonospora phaseoli TaxID=1144548 RepID=A0A1H6UVK1_9ACTN|nr:Xaa-Pro dipeptidyl-peptidase [Micromonospora phaseoli]PZV93825.1 dipeptidyl-peptidase IV [Micromonospora phaseoli]GIJ80731.1 Xaa-Pro dipeptidyl-peptidase [Micromonospora phaseoli]SEI96453.1 X-Pro dipeptidyl-peptidase [Micromonospora phaseoli]
MRRSPHLALLGVGLSGALALGAAPAPAAAQPTATAPPGIVVVDGMTQPVFSLADAIEERVYVETTVDTDHDGRRDRVAIDVSRPRETATEGFKVPVIFEHSPYRKDVWYDVPYPSVLVDELPQNGLARRSGLRSTDVQLQRAGAKANLPGSLDDYYVPRGYAVVLGQSVGTGDSDGCPTSGDQAETLGTRAVVDWLNGRAKGYDANGAAVTADWSTGAVGMTGVSYNGTLPNQVATTGVPGLRTIVPVAAISSWYDYYRANGLVVAPGTYQGEDVDVLAQFTAGRARAQGSCADEIAELTARQDRITGDYSPFWADRDHLDARKVRASVLVVHGLNDWNVKTEHFAGWWDELTRHRVPRRIWLHQGGHGGPGNTASVTLPDGRTWTWKQTENRWFDYWLWDVRNGIMDEPTAVVQREDRVYTTYANWPDPGARTVPLRLAATDAAGTGALTSGRPPKAKIEQRFVDEGRTLHPDALVADPDVASPNRLAYRSPTLTRDVRISGRPEMRLRMAVDNKPDANLTAYLVDYGPAGSAVAPRVVTRGWMDPQNRRDPSRTEPLRQGRLYDLRWTLEPKDHVFPAGHRIGLVVFSSDQEYTLLPLGGTRLRVAPHHSELRLPVVGGRTALAF